MRACTHAPACARIRSDRARCRARQSNAKVDRSSHNATRSRSIVRRASSGDEDDARARRAFDVNDEIEADIAQYVAKKQRANELSGTTSESDERRATTGFDKVKDAIDAFLLYDFFVIVFILVWLVIGASARLSKGQGLAYDEPFLGTWLFLWPILFQPLLGVHMLATLVSPAIGWAKKKKLLSEDAWQ